MTTQITLAFKYSPIMKTQKVLPALRNYSPRPTGIYTGGQRWTATDRAPVQPNTSTFGLDTSGTEWHRTHRPKKKPLNASATKHGACPSIITPATASAVNFFCQNSGLLELQHSFRARYRDIESDFRVRATQASTVTAARFY